MLAASLTRLPEHDIAADVGIADHHRTPVLEFHNAAFGDSDRAVRLRSRVSGFDLAHLQAGVVGVGAGLSRPGSYKILREVSWTSGFPLA